MTGVIVCAYMNSSNWFIHVGNLANKIQHVRDEEGAYLNGIPKPEQRRTTNDVLSVTYPHVSRTNIFIFYYLDHNHIPNPILCEKMWI
jgi:hypothetical protein